MKVEFYDRYLWPTKTAAKLAVGDWIEMSCINALRLHSAIGMISPGRLRKPTHSDGACRLITVSTKRAQAHDMEARLTESANPP